MLGNEGHWSACSCKHPNWDALLAHCRAAAAIAGGQGRARRAEPPDALAGPVSATAVFLSLPAPDAILIDCTFETRCLGSWQNLGPAAPSQQVALTFALKHANAGALEQRLVEVSDPGHARYGSFLTSSEVRAARIHACATAAHILFRVDYKAC